MDDDDLERFSSNFGAFGDDPYIAPIPGRDHVIAVRRRADERFVSRHVREPDLLVLWDNRSVLHRATAGYDGYDRELHRTTIA